MDEEAESFVTHAPHLLNSHLTPKLRLQIENALAAHENKLDPRSSEDLQRIRQNVTRQWDKVYKTGMLQFAAAESDLELFAFTIAGIIGIEYVSDKLPVDGLPLAAHILTYGGATQRARATETFDISESQLVKGIEKIIPYMIDEFLLDREHVEFRFRTVAKGEGSYVKKLYQQEEIGTLLDIIAKDEAMLKQLASWSELCREIYQGFPELLQFNFQSLYPERPVQAVRSRQPTQHKSFRSKVENPFRRKNAKGTSSSASDRLSALFTTR